MASFSALNGEMAQTRGPEGRSDKRRVSQKARDGAVLAVHAHARVFGAP